MSPEEIRTRRLAYPLSVAELAGMLGVARETVHRWEAGRGRIPAAKVRALEVAFGLRAPASGTWACQSIPGGCACRCHAIAAGRKTGARRPAANRWDGRQEAVMRRMVADGARPPEIADALSAEFGIPRTAPAVFQRASHLGLSWRGTGWYTENEAERLLGVGPRRLRIWRSSGALPAVRHVGVKSGAETSWWRISADALEAFVRLHAGIDLDPARIRDAALRARAEIASAVNRRRAG